MVILESVIIFLIIVATLLFAYLLIYNTYHSIKIYERAITKKNRGNQKG